MNRAKILGNSYAIEITNACSDFESYAENKVSELEGEMTGSELAGALVGGVLTLATGPLVGKIASKIGQEVAKVIAGAITDKIKDQVKQASSNSDEAADLRRAINLITQGARDSSTITRQRIDDTLSPMISGIQTKVNAGDILSDQESALTGTFYMAQTDIITENVTSYLGIPDSTKAMQTRIQVYERLIEDFEEQYFKATSTLRSQIYWSTLATSRSGAREYAHRTARRAAEKRRQALEGTTGID